MEELLKKQQREREQMEKVLNLKKQLEAEEKTLLEMSAGNLVDEVLEIPSKRKAEPGASPAKRLKVEESAPTQTPVIPQTATATQQGYPMPVMYNPYGYAQYYPGYQQYGGQPVPVKQPVKAPSQPPVVKPSPPPPTAFSEKPIPPGKVAKPAPPQKDVVKEKPPPPPKRADATVSQKTRPDRYSVQSFSFTESGGQQVHFEGSLGKCKYNTGGDWKHFTKTVLLRDVSGFFLDFAALDASLGINEADVAPVTRFLTEVGVTFVNQTPPVKAKPASSAAAKNRSKTTLTVTIPPPTEDPPLVSPATVPPSPIGSPPPPDTQQVYVEALKLWQPRTAIISVLTPFFKDECAVRSHELGLNANGILLKISRENSYYCALLNLISQPAPGLKLDKKQISASVTFDGVNYVNVPITKVSCKKPTIDEFSPEMMQFLTRKFGSNPAKPDVGHLIKLRDLTGRSKGLNGTTARIVSMSTDKVVVCLCGDGSNKEINEANIQACSLKHDPLIQHGMPSQRNDYANLPVATLKKFAGLLSIDTTGMQGSDLAECIADKVGLGVSA